MDDRFEELVTEYYIKAWAIEEDPEPAGRTPTQLLRLALGYLTVAAEAIEAGHIKIGEALALLEPFHNPDNGT